MRQIADPNGFVSDTYSYTAFGEPLASTGSTANEFRYVGEEADSNSGFYYLRTRWMDPASGRFASVDPFEGGARPLSLNKYLYAEASPAWLTDPTGLFGISEALTSIALYGIQTSLARPAMPSLRYTIYFRLFAPWESFGPLNLYRGDNRSFSTSLTVPSKINSNITVDVRGNRIYNQRAWSDESRMLGRTGYASPSLSVTKGGSGNSLEATVAAAFPLHPAWDIDATMKITWKPQAAGNVCFEGDVVGDAFPNAEVFVKGGGKTTMIHTFQTSYNKQIGPPVNLAGNGSASMGAFNKCD